MLLQTSRPPAYITSSLASLSTSSSLFTVDTQSSLTAFEVLQFEQHDSYTVLCHNDPADDSTHHTPEPSKGYLRAIKDSTTPSRSFEYSILAASSPLYQDSLDTSEDH